MIHMIGVGGKLEPSAPAVSFFIVPSKTSL
jgi:hypothetical protein